MITVQRARLALVDGSLCEEASTLGIRADQPWPQAIGVLEANGYGAISRIFRRSRIENVDGELTAVIYCSSAGEELTVYND